MKTDRLALGLKTIPAQQYARFIHKGPTPDLPLTLDYVYHTWAAQTERPILYSLVIEHSERNLGVAAGEFERKIYIPLA
jgi:predicted transcriptional regulator YdeE